MIKKFIGEFRWLSNFTPVEVTLSGEVYPSVENAYVAAKTVDKTLRGILQKITAAEAKKFGRMMPIRSDWNTIRLEVMEQLLRQKFDYPEFFMKLSDTGDQEIIEGNTWHDNFWGSCVCEECGDKGLNHLGKIIMRIRGEYQLPLDFYGD